MANTTIYQEEWKTKLQELLDAPLYFKEFCDVTYTTSKVINSPYRNDATASSYTRGAAYTFNDITVTNESMDIATAKISPEFIDRADLAQSDYASQMTMAERQGVALNEALETAVMATYGSFGNTVDDGDLATATNGGSGNAIILSSTNVIEVVRKIRTKIVEDAGLSALNARGASVFWSPADYEMLVAYAQGAGFTVADDALLGRKVRINGMDHYESNFLTTATGVRHIVAGVNKTLALGILSTTYGDIMVDEKDPNMQSGVSVVSRVDYGTKVWTPTANLLVDVQIDSDGLSA